MSLDAANDLLNNVGGPPGFKFEAVNDICRMIVTGADTRQQTDFATRKPKFYDDGNPMMQLVITGDETDAEGNRTGEETRLYAKGQMLKVIKEAIVTAGGSGLEIGGKLAVKLTGFEDTGKGNPMKVFVAKWDRPTQTVALDEFA